MSDKLASIKAWALDSVASNCGADEVSRAEVDMLRGFAGAAIREEGCWTAETAPNEGELEEALVATAVTASEAAVVAK